MKQFLFSVIFILVSCISYAQPSAIEAPIEMETPSGEVIFIRDTGVYGSAIVFKTFLDGQLVCRLNNKRFSKHGVPAGTHQYATQYHGKNQKVKTITTDIEVEAGKIHYVLLVNKMGWWKNELYAVEIDETVAQKMIAVLKEDEKY